ncbi:MAG: energy transducer TonB [Ignavibacteriales bacterium]|nr:energy transducer TonB [Ignavibacteriales bacterium]
MSQRKHEVELISLISDKNEKNVIPPKLTISSDSLLTLIKYPEIAKFAGVDGIVEIKFIVNKNGEVENISKIIGIGAGCDENTILTFEKLIFEPALKQNKPVDIEMIAIVNFKINNK